MKHTILLFCALAMQFTAEGSAPYLISFFIKPLILPKEETTGISKSKQASFSAHPLSHTGIFVFYAGVSTSSDQDGQVLLPRKTAEPVFHIFITERLSPLPLTPSKRKTILGFTTKPKTELQHLVYRREKDPEVDIYVWRVDEVPWPPYKKIPYDAIIIFANPEKIISPLGRTVTQFSENFILPDFHITSTADTALDALRFLTLKSFVAPLSLAYSFHPQDIQKLLKT